MSTPTAVKLRAKLQQWAAELQRLFGTRLHASAGAKTLLAALWIEVSHPKAPHSGFLRVNHTSWIRDGEVRCWDSSVVFADWVSTLPESPCLITTPLLFDTMASIMVRWNLEFAGNPEPQSFTQAVRVAVTHCFNASCTVVPALCPPTKLSGKWVGLLLISPDGSMLLQQRESHDQSFAHCWDITTTVQVDSDSIPAIALARMFHRQFGIHPSAVPIRNMALATDFTLAFPGLNGDRNYVECYVAFTCGKLLPKAPEPEECRQMAWTTTQQVARDGGDVTPMLGGLAAVAVCVAHSAL